MTYEQLKADRDGLLALLESVESVMSATEGLTQHTPEILGRIRKELHQHRCPEWDFLPITRRMVEYDACLCQKRGGKQ